MKQQAPTPHDQQNKAQPNDVPFRQLTFSRVSRARSTSAGYCCPSPPGAPAPPRFLLFIPPDRDMELLPCLLLLLPPPVYPLSGASARMSCGGVPALTARAIAVATESDERQRTRKDRRTFAPHFRFF